MILINGTCNICGSAGWTLMYRGERCLRCIRAGNFDAALAVTLPAAAAPPQPYLVGELKK